VTGVTVNEDYFGDTPTTVGSMGIIDPESAITWIKASPGAGSDQWWLRRSTGLGCLLSPDLDAISGSPLPT
jgi:hypothetical protein